METRQFIKRAAEQIGKKFHPKKIILFGSYANGHPNKDSDIDLLVVFKDKQPAARRYAQICRELEPMIRPVDVLVRSTKDIQYRLKIGDPFIEEIIHTGKVLYEN